jgi:biopolymer transport protein ExbD
MMRSHATAVSEADVDMTSMLDVVFIMLIFFIVTTSFVKESGLALTRPTTSTAPIASTTTTAVLTIHHDGSVDAGGRIIDPRTIPAWIENQRRMHEVTQVIVQADADASTEALVTVVDQLKIAGIDKVSVGTFASSSAQ